MRSPFGTYPRKSPKRVWKPGDTGVPVGFKPSWNKEFDREMKVLLPSFTGDPDAARRDATAHAKLSVIANLLPMGWYPDRDDCERVELLVAAAFRQQGEQDVR